MTDFKLSTTMRRHFLLSEKEHEEDMLGLLGSKLYAKAQRLGIERIASNDTSNVPWITGNIGKDVIAIRKEKDKDAAKSLLFRSASSSLGLGSHHR